MSTTDKSVADVADVLKKYVGKFNTRETRSAIVAELDKLFPSIRYEVSINKGTPKQDVKRMKELKCKPKVKHISTAVVWDGTNHEEILEWLDSDGPEHMQVCWQKIYCSLSYNMERNTMDLSLGMDGTSLLAPQVFVVQVDESTSETDVFVMTEEEFEEQYERL